MASNTARGLQDGWCSTMGEGCVVSQNMAVAHNTTTPTTTTTIRCAQKVGGRFFSHVSLLNLRILLPLLPLLSLVSLLSPLFVLWLCPSLPPSLRPTLLPFLDPPVSALPLFSSSYLRGSSCTPGPQMVAAQEDPAQIGSSAVGTTCQAAIPEKTESASSHQKT